MAQSIEPQIADLANSWLKQYKLKYFIEQDAPNEEIKNAHASLIRKLNRMGNKKK